MILILFLLTLAIGLLAQWHVKRTYARHSLTPTTGGYTGAGRESLHLTTRGHAQPPPGIRSEGEQATEQFTIADQRPVETVLARIRDLGFDPVWKDWDPAFH